MILNLIAQILTLTIVEIRKEAEVQLKVKEIKEEQAKIGQQEELADKLRKSGETEYAYLSLIFG